MLIGYYCICIHDFPEDEGIVYFYETPKVGDEFELPSSDYKETWKISSVNEEDLVIHAVEI
jgi:hypothetical protein